MKVPMGEKGFSGGEGPPYFGLWIVDKTRPRAECGLKKESKKIGCQRENGQGEKVVEFEHKMS